MTIDTLELHTGSHLLQGDLLWELCQKYGNRRVVLTDSLLEGLYGAELSKRLEAGLFVVPRGEEGKTRAVKEKIEDEMLQAGFGRDTVMIGLGGGSVTDLAGFVAATYLRGIPLILVPTTLLAMVDAAIGGKTAVNTAFGKNLIGAFYHPRAIVNDLTLLKTLPEKETRNGLVEILKMGLVFDAALLAPSTSLEELMVKAAEAKFRVVREDPWEAGMRRILNFGHTIGHALEAVSRFTLSHGEAVAIGCVVESYLSRQLGYLPIAQFSEIEKLFGSMRLPTIYDRKALLQAMAWDKKKTTAGIRCVLIDAIGHAVPFGGAYCRTVEEQDFRGALAYMEERYG